MYNLFKKLWSFNALLTRLFQLANQGHLSEPLSCRVTAQDQRVGKGSLKEAGGALPQGRLEGLESVCGTRASEGSGSSGNFQAASSL